MAGRVATTLKIAADLKRRIVAAAKAADKSPHAFMLEAIEHQTLLDEQRRGLVADAVAARSEAPASVDGYAAADVHRYLAARVHGDRTPRPKLRTCRKYSTLDTRLRTWSDRLIFSSRMRHRPPSPRST
jgi:predicted transcriptional regulator